MKGRENPCSVSKKVEPP